MKFHLVKTDEDIDRAIGALSEIVKVEDMGAYPLELNLKVFRRHLRSHYVGKVYGEPCCFWNEDAFLFGCVYFNCFNNVRCFLEWILRVRPRKKAARLIRRAMEGHVRQLGAQMYFAENMNACRPDLSEEDENRVMSEGGFFCEGRQWSKKL